MVVYNTLAKVRKEMALQYEGGGLEARVSHIVKNLISLYTN